MKRFLTALLAVGLLVASLSAASASTPRSLSFRGAGGTAFVVTVDGRWQLDFGHMTAAGGSRYEGVALELLGKPANDGLATIAVRLPDAPHGAAGREVHALGAVDVHDVSVVMPPGRYLMVLIGDHPVRLTIPLVGSSRIRGVAPASAHSVRFVESHATASLSPGATGLYAASLSVRLPLAQDPLVMTHAATTVGPDTQFFDLTECVRRNTSPCESEKDPTFGTGNASNGGARASTEDYYDGLDGLRAGQVWFDRAAVRGSASGASLYVAAVVISGGNR